MQLKVFFAGKVNKKRSLGTVSPQAPIGKPAHEEVNQLTLRKLSLAAGRLPCHLSHKPKALCVR